LEARSNNAFVPLRPDIGERNVRNIGGQQFPQSIAAIFRKQQDRPQLAQPVPEVRGRFGGGDERLFASRKCPTELVLLGQRQIGLEDLRAGFLRAVQFDDRIDRNSARETEGDDAPGRGSGKQIDVFYNARVKGLQKLCRDHAPNAAAVARQNSVRRVGHVSISSSGLSPFAKS